MCSRAATPDTFYGERGLFWSNLGSLPFILACPALPVARRMQLLDAAKSGPGSQTGVGRAVTQSP